jgi:hypothetical protein
MTCLSCDLEYMEHPAGLCADYHHWAAYVSEMEARSQTNYLFYAERSEDEYSSTVDARFDHGLDRDTVLEILTQFAVTNKMTNDRSYHWKGITILRDGFDLPLVELTALEKEVEVAAQKRVDEWERKKGIEAEEKKRKAQEEGEEFRRGMYEALKKEFENKD